MDRQLCKNIAILSALAGVVLALASLIPVVVKLAVFVLMTCVCLPVIILIRRYTGVEVLTVKDSLLTGALSGFISYITFSIIFLPLVFLLSYFFPISYLGGFVLILHNITIGLLIMFTIFISSVSVIFNAFSSLLYYYIMSSFIGEKNG